MLLRIVVFLLPWTVGLFGAVSGDESSIRNRRHLFDAQLTSPSEANPVLARVTAVGIEIPATELRAFLASEPPDPKRHGPLTAEERRALLDRLLDEHFLLAAAYREKADETPGIRQMLTSTLTMILAETLIAAEVDSKASTPDEHARRLKEFRMQIFDRAEIVVSNEGYAEFKTALKSSAAPSEAVRTQPLATCNVGVVAVGDALQACAQIPVGKRPVFEQPTELIELLRQIMTPALIVAAARERGLERAAGVQEKLQINRNVLTRFYALDRLTDKAVARMKAPGQDARLRAWYEAHLKDRYTFTDRTGEIRTVSFSAERESIENDYFDSVLAEVRATEVATLRRDQVIDVDEKRLDELPLTWTVSAEP